MGSGGDTGIDAIAIIVNNNLITDVDTVDDLLHLNGYLDVEFVLVQAGRSPHFESGKLAKLGFGVKDFFGEGKLPRNDAVKTSRRLWKHCTTKAENSAPRSQNAPSIM